MEDEILNVGLIFEKLEKKVCKFNIFFFMNWFYCWLLRLRIDCSVFMVWVLRFKFLMLLFLVFWLYIINILVFGFKLWLDIFIFCRIFLGSCEMYWILERFSVIVFVGLLLVNNFVSLFLVFVFEFVIFLLIDLYNVWYLVLFLVVLYCVSLIELIMFFFIFVSIL